MQELEAENANLKANQQVLISPTIPGGASGEPVEEQELSIASVSAAVEIAAKSCPNLVILDTAWKSADDSPFQRPFDIYKALSDLNEVVDAWRAQRKAKGNGGDFLSHLRERGWGKRSSNHISDTTKGKYRAYYEFEYRGTKQLFEPHITIGAGDANSCASIHYIFDQKAEKIVIGHVGKHLPNTKT